MLRMGEEKNTCVTWKFGSGRLHLGDLQMCGIIVINLLVTRCINKFNIQKLYALLTLYLCVVWTATCATYSIKWLVFITKMKSVYSAVRTGPLNKAFCAPSLKVKCVVLKKYGIKIGVWYLNGHSRKVVGGFALEFCGYGLGLTGEIL
jgi:hypothetical protein